MGVKEELLPDYSIKNRNTINCRNFDQSIDTYIRYFGHYSNNDKWFVDQIMSNLRKKLELKYKFAYNCIYCIVKESSSWEKHLVHVITSYMNKRTAIKKQRLIVLNSLPVSGKRELNVYQYKLILDFFIPLFCVTDKWWPNPNFHWKDFKLLVTYFHTMLRYYNYLCYLVAKR